MARVSWRRVIIGAAVGWLAIAAVTVLLAPLVVTVPTPETMLKAQLGRLRHEIREFHAKYTRLPTSLDELRLDPELLVDDTGEKIQYSADDLAGRIHLSGRCREPGAQTREVVLDFATEPVERMARIAEQARVELMTRGEHDWVRKRLVLVLTFPEPIPHPFDCFPSVRFPEYSEEWEPTARVTMDEPWPGPGQQIIRIEDPWLTFGVRDVVAGFPPPDGTEVRVNVRLEIHTDYTGMSLNKTIDLDRTILWQDEPPLIWSDKNASYDLHW